MSEPAHTTILLLLSLVTFVHLRTIVTAVPLTLSTTAWVSCTRQLQASEGLHLVPEADSKQFPLSCIGQLANGCTGFLIGPCHVMTVAHCVHEPWRAIWWGGLDFYPGRNVPPDKPSSGWAPLGHATKRDVDLHPNWTNDASGSKGKPAADAAIIITSEPIGKQLGWLDYKLPMSISSQLKTGADPSQGAAGRTLSADLMDDAVRAAGIKLKVAGYPDNKPNGSMWDQCCQPLDWEFQGNLLWHDCYVRGGNSGSPVWIEWPASEATAAVGSSADNLSSGRKLLQGTHRVQAQQQQGMPGHSSQLQPLLQVVGVHSSSLKFPIGSDTAVYAEAVYADELARQASSRSVMGSLAEESAPQCVVGAGGREADGDNVLLPVAVPFTGDTYKWIEDTLQQHTCS